MSEGGGWCERKAQEPVHRLETMWLRGFFRSVLGLTPSHNQIAAALLNLPPEAARERVTNMAVTALMAERERARLLRTPNNHNNNLSTTTGDVAGRPRPRPPAEVRESAIPGAGSGLFLRCDITANPGDFIAIYAGTYTPPAPPITSGADGTSIIVPAPTPGDSGQYVINLEEGGYLDGATHARRARESAAAGVCAGWATAALANHPPEGVEPNVVAIPIDWGRRVGGSMGGDEVESSHALNHHHRSLSLRGSHSQPVVVEAEDKNKDEDEEEEDDDVESAARELVNPMTDVPWYVDGATGVAVPVPRALSTKGLVFIASRTISPGSEIHFNYRLNPAGRDVPKWYVPVPDKLAWRIVDEAAQAKEEAEEEEEREREDEKC